MISQPARIDRQHVNRPVESTDLANGRLLPLHLLLVRSQRLERLVETNLVHRWIRRDVHRAPILVTEGQAARVFRDFQRSKVFS